MVITLIIALAVSIVAVFFALENTTMITVIFFGYGVDGSIALFMLLAVAVGVLVGMLIMTPGFIKRSITNAHHRKQIGTLESTIDEHEAKLSEMNKPKPEAPKSETPKPE